jgi:hypothetical protein
VARIPETEIERLKSEVSVERLVEAAGVASKRAGKDLLGRCPFHDDAEASLVVMTCLGNFEPFTPGRRLGCEGPHLFVEEPSSQKLLGRNARAGHAGIGTGAAQDALGASQFGAQAQSSCGRSRRCRRAW